MSHKFLPSILLAFALYAFPAFAQPGAGSVVYQSVGTAPNRQFVVQWNNALLQGVRDSRLGPPMVARALAIAHTCMFDAWAAYDGKAVGTRLGGALRRLARERRLDNKTEAVSFAAYRAAVDLFPASQSSVFDPLMARLGYGPTNRSADPSLPLLV